MNTALDLLPAPTLPFVIVGGLFSLSSSRYSATAYGG
jgi:hypothetical protein